MSSSWPPRKNAAFSTAVPLMDADGDLVTGATGLDTEVSTDFGTYADAATESVEIATGSGMYKVALSAGEMNGDHVGVIIKTSSSGAKTTPLSFHTSTRQVDDLAYPATSGRSMVVDAAGLVDANAVKLGPTGAGTAQTARDLGSSVLLSSGTGTGQVKLSAGYVAPNWGDVGNPTTTVGLSGTTVGVATALTNLPAITANWLTNAGIANDAITAAKIADGAIDAATFAAGAITAAAIAADAITDAKVASDVTIASVTGSVGSVTADVGITQAGADKAWSTTARVLTAGTNIVLAKGVGVTGFNDIAATAIVSAGAITTSSGKVSGVILVDITTSNTDMRGTDSAALASAWTATRAGYVDNINIGGPVASSAEVVIIQNNTRVVRVVPSVFERPDSGSTAFRIELLLYDTQGNMEAPDSAPTIAVVNQGGTSRDANLDSTTMALVSTGRYRSTYAIDTAHALEELMFSFSLVEGGATRIYVNGAQVVDTTAVDFTAADRTKLDTLHDTRIPGVIQPQTGDSFAVVNSGTHGNAVIKGYVDDIGIAGAGLTALGDTRIANLDLAVSTRMATYAQPSGFLAATFPSGTVANTTNITAGTITNVTNLTNAPTVGDLTATMKTSIQTAAEAGLVTHRLDELLNADSDIDGAAPPAVGSVFHELMTKTAGSFTFDQTTDSLEALRDRGDSAWTTATGFSTHTAGDVWGVGSRVLTAGTNIVLAKGTGVTGFNDISTADVDARFVAIGLDHLVSASVVGADVADNSIMAKLASKSATADWDSFVNTTDALEAIRDRGDAAWGAGAVPSVAQIADGVWDETMADHLTVGTTGNKLNAAATAGDPWVTSLPGAYGSGTAGYIVGSLERRGSGAVSHTLTINDTSSNPIDGVEVWVTTDAGGGNIVAGTLVTDSLGQVTFLLDSGIYFAFRQRANFSFTNPQTFTVP